MTYRDELYRCTLNVSLRPGSFYIASDLPSYYYRIVAYVPRKPAQRPMSPVDALSSDGASVVPARREISISSCYLVTLILYITRLVLSTFGAG
jgi:hypothetical protein